METVELFAGTQSFSKVAKQLGHETFTIDSDETTNPDKVVDVLLLPFMFITMNIDILWASPPCTTFSVSSIGTHWKGGSENTLNVVMKVEDKQNE